MDIQKHLKVLGMVVRDKVTGLEGVVSSVSFDLYGCIQAVITPKANKDGTSSSGCWVDITRLKVISKNPVMDSPDFSIQHISEGKRGAAEKPRITL